jgi:RNA polymerase sigma-70 factor, ECF subfamily
MRIQPAINSGPATVQPATSEQRLVQAVLAKERKSTAEFVELCTDWIYGFVRHRLMPRAELVEDLMQEILLAAWQALPSYRQESSLRSWVLGVARHKLDDYYRRRILETDLPEEDSGSEELTITPAFEDELDSATQQERIEKILADLPEAYSLALLWRYRDEKSAREMAELTGKTEKAIERLLARARQSFRRRWIDARP